MKTHAQRVEWGKKGASVKWSKTTFAERFWARVEKSASGCWLWKGSRYKSGYGKYKIRGKHTTAHRIAYELTYGPIPEGFKVLHDCDNPPCCNPEHVYCGTHQDNMDDMVRRGRASGPKTHANYPRAVGERCGMAKLRSADVVQIRKLYKTGRYNQAAIGKMYGVRQDEISRIVNGNRWGHIT